MDITCIGLDPLALSDLLTRGTDHAGVRLNPVVDNAGGWPLRCCLTTSRVGDVIAVIGFSPFPWDSAYRETGPVVVHAHGCAGSDGTFPTAFEGRDQVVRAFGGPATGALSQVYDLNRLVAAGSAGELDPAHAVRRADRVRPGEQRRLPVPQLFGREDGHALHRPRPRARVTSSGRRCRWSTRAWDMGRRRGRRGMT